MKDILELLHLKVAGVLGPEDEARLEAELSSRPDLVAESRELSRVEARLASAVSPSAPSSAARGRLLEAVEGPSRFLPFLDDAAEIFGRTASEMMDVLSLTQDTDTWTPTGVPGVTFKHFESGPALAHADTGLVRFAPDARFPQHSHHGRELTFVLQGELRFDDGTVLLPGDQVLLDKGSHAVVAGPEETIYLTFHEGLTVDGQ